MRINCKYGKNKKKEIVVEPTNELNIILKKIKEVNKKSKFVFKGFTYSLASIFTFEEIGITDNTEIDIVTPSRAGNIIDNLII